MNKLCKWGMFLVLLAAVSAAAYAVGWLSGRRKRDAYITLYDSGVEF